MKKLRIYIPFILILLSVAANNALAANYITVAAIGAAPSLDKNQDPQKLVDQVIEFWKHELKQVVPTKNSIYPES